MQAVLHQTHPDDAGAILLQILTSHAFCNAEEYISPTDAKPSHSCHEAPVYSPSQPLSSVQQDGLTRKCSPTHYLCYSPALEQCNAGHLHIGDEAKRGLKRELTSYKGIQPGLDHHSLRYSQSLCILFWALPLVVPWSVLVRAPGQITAHKKHVCLKPDVKLVSLLLPLQVSMS